MDLDEYARNPAVWPLLDNQSVIDGMVEQLRGAGDLSLSEAAKLHPWQMAAVLLCFELRVSLDRAWWFFERSTQHAAGWRDDARKAKAPGQMVGTARRVQS